LCKCECGNTVIAIGSKLRHGRTKSCGCLHQEMLRSGVRSEQSRILSRKSPIIYCP
jgi:hypothetical protein